MSSRGSRQAAEPGPDAPEADRDSSALAATAISLLIAREQTVGTGESLTGGLVAAALTSVPGASAAVRGGIVAYAADLKESLLAVPAMLLERFGTVHRDVAIAMAAGVRQRLDVTVGVATTGVAGPDLADGQPVGTVHIAVSRNNRSAHRELRLAGDRDRIRTETVRHALSLLAAVLLEDIT